MQTTEIKAFKKGSANKMVMDMAYIFGVIKASELDADFIRACYGSIYFTENYDALPLTVRMWLKIERWNELLKFAELFDCDTPKSQILYCDFIDRTDEYINTGPLIVTNGEVAVCLAPKMIDLDEFDITKETTIEDILEEATNNLNLSSHDKPKPVNTVSLSNGGRVPCEECP